MNDESTNESINKKNTWHYYIIFKRYDLNGQQQQQTNKQTNNNGKKAISIFFGMLATILTPTISKMRSICGHP